MKKIILLLCISIGTFSITAQITGTVSDEIGPLAFANIVIKNSTKGTISDHIGQFSIDAQKGRYFGNFFCWIYNKRNCR